MIKKMFEFIFGSKHSKPDEGSIKETGWKPIKKNYGEEVKVDSAAYSQAYQKWLKSSGAERSIRPPDPKDFPEGGKKSVPEEEEVSPHEEVREEGGDVNAGDYDVDAFLEAQSAWLENMEPGKEPKLEDFPTKEKGGEFGEVDQEAFQKAYTEYLRNPDSGPRPRKSDFLKK